MTKQLKISKGQEFWCLHPRMPQPIKGKIIALTDKADKLIGIEFPEPISGFHNCDGRGAQSSCLWVLPRHIHTDEEFEEVKKIRQLSQEHAAELEANDVEELDLSLLDQPPAEEQPAEDGNV